MVPVKTNSTSRQGAALIVIIVFLALIFHFSVGNYLNLNTLLTVLVQAAPVMIVAAPMTFVLAAGWIDLSVGATLYLSIVVSLTLAGTTTGVGGTSNLGTYFVTIILATLLGALNAILIQVLRVHPLLVTLGTLTLFRGIALHIVDSGNRAADGIIQVVGRSSLGPVPVPVLIAFAFVIVCSIALSHMGIGRTILAVGGSPRSAIETGLRINAARVVVFSGLGFAAGVAAVVIGGRVGTVQTSLGEGFEFTVITAVVVGGTSLFGGKASVWGSALGAILLALIFNGLNRLDASIYFYDVAVGIILFLAVFMDASINRALFRKTFSFFAKAKMSGTRFGPSAGQPSHTEKKG